MRQMLLSEGGNEEEIHYSSTPWCAHTHTHTAQSDLVISSSPSPGGSEGCRALL